MEFSDICLICFHTYKRSTKREQSHLPLSVSRNVVNSCRKYLHSAITEKSPTKYWEPLPNGKLPFCDLCFKSASQLTELAELLENFQRDINELIFTFSLSVLHRRRLIEKDVESNNVVEIDISDLPCALFRIPSFVGNSQPTGEEDEFFSDSLDPLGDMEFQNGTFNTEETQSTTEIIPDNESLFLENTDSNRRPNLKLFTDYGDEQTIFISHLPEERANQNFCLPNDYNSISNLEEETLMTISKETPEVINMKIGSVTLPPPVKIEKVSEYQLRINKPKPSSLATTESFPVTAKRTRSRTRRTRTRKGPTTSPDGKPMNRKEVKEDKPIIQGNADICPNSKVLHHEPNSNDTSVNIRMAMPENSMQVLAGGIVQANAKVMPRHPRSKKDMTHKTFPGSLKKINSSSRKHFKNKKKKRYNKCPHCDRVSRTPSELIEHIRVHTGERPFTCKICNYAFTQKSNMRCHYLNVHGHNAV